MSETRAPYVESPDRGTLLDLLKRAQEFVGIETSTERQQPKLVPGLYVYPPTEGERLRAEAAKADRRDALIAEIRAALASARGER